ncbi:MAG: DUF308 domain-containing protein [Bacteroidales bacterium]|nr:DUF308 domain-containing protein [Bacteroidales bacterium]
MKRHFENLAQKAGRAVRHWWMLMLAGVLCVAAGIAVFVFPLESYVALSICFGVLMLIVGAVQLIIASTSNNYLMMKGYVIVGGVLDLILGLFMCLYPGITLMLIPIMLGIWMMYHSFMIVAFGGDLDTFNVKGNGLVIAAGILLLLLSILILMNPFGVGVAAVVVMAGIGLLLFGIILCVMSLKLKDIHNLVIQTEN